MDYAIRRELVQIYGEMERQLGSGSRSASSIKPSNIPSDFERIISERCSRLTDTQKNKVTENMMIHRICSAY
jgi:hypothetical protein